MTTKNNSEAKSDALKLVLTRTFDAPRSLVWQAWTQPEHLKQWCAPRGFSIPTSEGNLRPGGEWRASMVSTHTGTLYLRGVYREIIENELLVFTHAWADEKGKIEHETIMTVRFADEGNKTKITLEQTNFASPESRDGHQGGWSECLDRLAELLAKLK